MSNIAYARITLDDGSNVDIEPAQFQTLVDCMALYVEANTDSVVVFDTVCGSKFACFVSKVQDVFLSTSEQRMTAFEINKKLKAESKMHKSWDDDD